MEKKNNSSETEEVKLEDILKSIRGIIDNNNTDSRYTSTEEDVALLEEEEEENILELVNVIEEEGDNYHISQNTKDYAQGEINKLKSVMKNGHYVEHGHTLNLLVNDITRPLVKDWLENNLPKIVKDIVSEEVKKIVTTK